MSEYSQAIAAQCRVMACETKAVSVIELMDDLWRYALRTWRKPGVERASLCLQDDFSAPVSLLLMAGWLGEQKYPAQPALATSLSEYARQWDTQKVMPLRALRRAARRPQWSEWKRLLRDAELEAERLVLAELEQMVLAQPRAAEFGDTTRAWLLLLLPESATCQEQAQHIEAFLSALEADAAGY